MDKYEFRKLMSNHTYIFAGSPLHLYMHKMAERARKITMKMNNKSHSANKVRKLFFKLTQEKTDNTFTLFPPFTTDYGQNIKIGKGVFINAGCTFQDQGGIFIGNNVLIGPQVVIATLNHDFNPNSRKSMNPLPVVIENNVWIDANVTICPGVTIGENSIIGAGAVVTKDISKNSVAVGVPAKIIKSIDI